MAMERLSARRVETVRDRGLYTDGKGLYLRIGPTGAKSWIYRYRVGKKQTDLGLGPWPDVSLADARERAAEQCKLRLNRQDPLLTRRAGRDQARLAAAWRMTFRQCAEAYIAAHRAGWKNPIHAKQWPSTLETYVYPVFGDLPVDAIDTALVVKALEPIWTAKAETASRVRGRIESVLGWATVRGFRHGDNPARWRGHLDNLLPAPSKAKRAARQAKGRAEHHAALPYGEIAAFIAELRKQDGVAAQALEIAILTAARTSEVIGARWQQFDLVERLWTVPGERMKAGREHRVPLSARVVEIFEALRSAEANAFVFAGPKGGTLSNMAMLKLLQRMGRGDLTVHGFRSTFRDWAAERTNFSREVAEAALAHTLRDKVEAAYRRGDLFGKRRQLMEAWARFCAVDKGVAQVVPITGRA